MTIARNDESPHLLKVSVTAVLYTAVTVRKQLMQINIATVYRPPAMNTDLFLAKLRSMRHSIQNGCPTLVLGDLKFDLFQSSSHKIVKVMEQLGYRQLVRTPTTDYSLLLNHVYITGQ